MIKKGKFIKNYKIRICFLLIFLFLILVFRPNLGFNRNVDQMIQQGKGVSISSQWELQTITIDNNWSDTAKKYNWCNGLGTEKTPYVIENVSFTNKYPNTSIIIKNANEYFQIRNCMFIDCNRGIKLENVSLGDIIDNNFTDSYLPAIELDNCRNMSISNNLIYDGQDYHIIIESSLYINVSRNIIDTMGGTRYGICLENVNYSEIEHNIVDFTGGYYKIGLYYSNYNIILNNSLINSGGSGLQIYQSNFNFISNNSIKDGSYGIEIIQESSQNKVIYNEIKTRDYGIFTYTHSDNNSIFSNTLENTFIYLYICNLNNVSFNYIKNPDTGIVISDSNESSILNNTIYHFKSKCIGEYNCINNIILGNICIPIPIDLNPLYLFLINLSIIVLVGITVILYLRKKK